MLFLLGLLAGILFGIGGAAALLIVVYLVCLPLAYFKIGSFRINPKMTRGNLIILGCTVVVLLVCIFGVRAISSYKETIETENSSPVSIQDVVK